MSDRFKVCQQHSLFLVGTEGPSVKLVLLSSFLLLPLVKGKSFPTIGEPQGNGAGYH